MDGREAQHQQWVGTTYGSSRMHRWLIQLLRVVDVRVLYGIADVLIVPPTMLINAKARQVTYRFYRQRIKYGRLKACWMTYRNHCLFAQVVIDKFAMYAGKKFSVKVRGMEYFLQLADLQDGFVMLSAHIGNYEIAGYTLSAEKKRLNVLVFGGEKESVMMNRSRLFKENNVRMIPTRKDLTHLFMIDKAMTDGEIVSVLADRTLGSKKTFSIEFMGERARIPQSPFLLATLKNMQVLSILVMKTANKEYTIEMKKMTYQDSGDAKENALNLAENYVNLLEETVRRYPTQWYNYFDFWSKA